MTEYLIRLPWPSSAMSQNGSHGHWTKKANARKAARRTAFTLARQQLVRHPMPDAELIFTYSPPDRRRRDVQNMPELLKAYIDGIADAMGCDDNKFRPVYPSEFGPVVKGGAVLVHIIPRTVILPVVGEIS